MVNFTAFWQQFWADKKSDKKADKKTAITPDAAKNHRQQYRLWDFHGGIYPPEMKTQSNGVPLRSPPLPPRLVLPLKQHAGKPGEVCVKPGDTVLRGQPLSRGSGRMLPIHASTSGTVLAIEPHTTAHASGLAAPCVVIEPDGEDRWITKQPWQNYRQYSRDQLIKRIHQFGIAGLGGAGFPTGRKLASGGDNIRTLIINAAECEPYITADDRLMQECAEQIIQGTEILIHLLQPDQVLIGIEQNKPHAIASLRQALQGHEQIQLRIIPVKYPSGGARQLTQILTGKQVPLGGRSSDIGVLMQNVGTVYAIKRAIIDGEPLTERVVTLTGNALQRPGNVWGRLGTPVSHLLEFAGFQMQPKQMVIMGGPLMGFTLADLQVPLVKISNCLLAPGANEMAAQPAEQNCIRCSACADACPVELLPQQLYWFSKGEQHDKARAYQLDACIECGICAWVCPSHIPLVQYFRQEKAQLRQIQQQTQQAADAKARFAARQARLEREKLARSQRHQQAAAQPDMPLADNSHTNLVTTNVAKPVTEQPVAKTITSITNQHPAHNNPDTELNHKTHDDPRQVALAAALARVKARKAQQNQQTPSQSTAATADKPILAADNVTPPSADDPRKAAVAAALARVRARKAQQDQQSQTQEQDQQISSPQYTAETASSAAPAADSLTTPSAADNATPPASDPRKAAVTAALARVRAHKAQQNQQTPSQGTAATADKPILAADNVTPPSADDPHKAAVAAALARVRARKAQQNQQIQGQEPQNQQSPEQELQISLSQHTAAITSSATPAADNLISASVADSLTPSSAADNAISSASDNATPSASDPRKAAVAAALARVRARKAQQNQQIQGQEQQNQQSQIQEQQISPSQHTAAITSSATPAADNLISASAADSLTPASVADNATPSASDPRKAAVAAALARVRARKALQDQQSQTQEQDQQISSPQHTTETADSAAPAADNLISASAADSLTPPSAADNAISSASDNATPSASDPRKAAVAAALARVRARKAQQNQQTPSQGTAATADKPILAADNVTPPSADDPRKAAVAAALARVRARKAQQNQQIQGQEQQNQQSQIQEQQISPSQHTAAITTSAVPAADNLISASAADSLTPPSAADNAISSASDNATPSASDPRKAAVAAALARVRARKAQQDQQIQGQEPQNQQSQMQELEQNQQTPSQITAATADKPILTTDNVTPPSADDPRKAAVAAALARVRARKAQQNQQSQIQEQEPQNQQPQYPQPQPQKQFVSEDS